MPFNSVTALPRDIKEVLPVGAQRIFVGAFNSASRQGKSEQDSFKIAWSAVKIKYRKIGNKWMKKELSSPSYIQGPSMVRENLAGSKKKPKKKK